MDVFPTVCPGGTSLPVEDDRPASLPAEDGCLALSCQHESHCTNKECLTVTSTPPWHPAYR